MAAENVFTEETLLRPSEGSPDNGLEHHDFEIDPMDIHAR